MGDEVLLLLIGFALTSVLGGALGLFFQTRSWSHQHRAQQRDEERARATKVFEEVSSLLDKRLYRMRLVFWAAKRHAERGGNEERLDDALEHYREVVVIWNDNLNRMLALVQAYFGGAARVQLEAQLYEEYSAAGRALDAFVREVRGARDGDVEVPPIGRRLTRLGHRVYTFNARLLNLLQEDQLGRRAPAARRSAAQTATPLLRVGERGDAVARLQRRLLIAGTFEGPIDGVFGTLTEAGVKAAQRSAGLDNDGIVGPQTWGALPSESVGDGVRAPARLSATSDASGAFSISAAPGVYSLGLSGQSTTRPTQILNHVHCGSLPVATYPALPGVQLSGTYSPISVCSGHQMPTTNAQGIAALTVYHSTGNLQLDVIPPAGSGLVNVLLEIGAVTQDSAIRIFPNGMIQDVPAGGTVSHNPTPTPLDPVGTAVTTPNPGTISIANTTPTQTPPVGFQLLGKQVVIDAPAASVAQPLRFVFRLDPSLLPAGSDPATVAVFRDGAAIADCADASGTATPDPCLAARTVPPVSSDLTLTILSSHASTWSFAVPAPDTEKTPQTITFSAPTQTTVGASPTMLTATASSGLPVTNATTGPCSVVGSTLTASGVGSCVVTASQAGNDQYDAAPDVQRTITVNKASTMLTAARAFKALLGLAKTRFSATLTRSDNGAPIAGQTIAMKVGGSVVCTATTQASGTAVCSERIGLLAGLFARSYTAAYAGNTIYLGSAATGALS